MKFGIKIWQRKKRHEILFCGGGGFQIIFRGGISIIDFWWQRGKGVKNSEKLMTTFMNGPNCTLRGLVPNRQLKGPNTAIMSTSWKLCVYELVIKWDIFCISSLIAKGPKMAHVVSPWEMTPKIALRLERLLAHFEKE